MFKFKFDKQAVACDTETTGLDMYNGDAPFAFSFTNFNGENFYLRFEVNPFTREVLYFKNPAEFQWLKTYYENPFTTKIFHNASFDVRMLYSIGVRVAGPIVDTIVLTHVCDNSLPTYKLKPLCRSLLGFSDDDEKDLQKSVISGRRVGKKKGYKLGQRVEEDYWLGDSELCKKYACKDTDRTMLLYKKFASQIMGDPDSTSIFEMEMDLLHVLINMEENGIRIDVDRLRELQNYYEGFVDDFTEKKKNLGYGELNTRSPKQMKKVFYDELNAPPMFTVSKDSKTKQRQRKLTTNSDALKSWAGSIPLADVILNISAAKHELNAFVTPIMKKIVNETDGFIIHPNYKQVGALTARLSCSNPNLMNIPNSGTKYGEIKNRMREVFIPRNGHVLYFPDYSQIEVWISAFTSKDPVMMKALLDGYDMHGDFNYQFHGEMEDYEKNKDNYRKKIKRGTFCVFYGGGMSQLADTLDCSQERAAEFLYLFKNKYKGLARYIKNLQVVADDIGYIVNPFGRKYVIHPDVAYKSFNYMIQGSAAEVMKRALLNVFNNVAKKYKGCKILLTIHDEICIEVPLRWHSKKLMKEIIKAMQGDLHRVFNIPKPFEVSMAWTKTRWSEKQEIEI